jgi:curved DNA-binding protein CbpA
VSTPDPFRTLGVDRSAGDAELRAAYRRLVQLHHPDHNHGSPESTRRFTEIQEAYAQVKLLRARQATEQAPPAAAAGDPGVEARLAAMERELAQARRRREQAARAARDAAGQAARDGQSARPAPRSGAGEHRPSDEELGYVSTDDSFAKIFDDLADEVTSRLRDGRHQAGSGAERPAGKSSPRRLADWIDELGSRLTGEK